MNHKLIHILITVVMVLLATTSGVIAQGEAPEAPLGTGFTYQGKLTDNGLPADTDYDFRFTLYNADAGGSQVGSPLDKGDVPVRQGIFTVELDFGASAFNGDARWLEVGVRPGNSTDGYTTLTPRQPLTAAPYALYARAAPWSGLSGVPAGFADGADNDTIYTAGSGLTLSSGQFSASFGGDGAAATVARSDHNHLGETWSGSNNTLVINGAFGAPNYSALMLSNTTFSGLRVESAGASGVFVNSAANSGVYVVEAGDPTTQLPNPDSNGFQVTGAQGNGLYVGRADMAGVYVNWATNGVKIGSADDDGMYVNNAGDDGVSINSANDDGVYVFSAVDGVQIDQASESGVVIKYASTGVYVLNAGYNGLYVDTAGDDGVGVYSAGGDGVDVYSAGTASTHYTSNEHNGFMIGGAQGNGMYVGRADMNGVNIYSAGYDGVKVNTASGNGLGVDSAGIDGLHVSSATFTGVYANTANALGEWGIYTPDKIHGSNVTFSSLSMVAQMSGSGSLSPGNLVAVEGMGTPLPGSSTPLPLVRLAEEAGSNGVIGVVESHMAFTPKPQHEGESGDPVMELRSAEGPALPGDYVSIIIYGVAQIKVDVTAEAVQPGMRLTAASLPGTARPLKTVSVEGVTLAESAPVIGIALSAPDEQGYAWVLVNPQ